MFTRTEKKKAKLEENGVYKLYVVTEREGATVFTVIREETSFQSMNLSSFS